MPRDNYFSHVIICRSTGLVSHTARIHIDDGVFSGGLFVTTHEHHGHPEDNQHHDHHGHHDHSHHVHMFRRMFWINLVLAIPVVGFSPMFG